MRSATSRVAMAAIPAACPAMACAPAVARAAAATAFLTLCWARAMGCCAARGCAVVQTGGGGGAAGFIHTRLCERPGGRGATAGRLCSTGTDHGGGWPEGGRGGGTRRGTGGEGVGCIVRAVARAGCAAEMPSRALLASRLRLAPAPLGRRLFCADSFSSPGAKCAGSPSPRAPSCSSLSSPVERVAGAHRSTLSPSSSAAATAPPTLMYPGASPDSLA